MENRKKFVNKNVDIKLKYYLFSFAKKINPYGLLNRSYNFSKSIKGFFSIVISDSYSSVPTDPKYPMDIKP